MFIVQISPVNSADYSIAHLVLEHTLLIFHLIVLLHLEHI